MVDAQVQKSPHWAPPLLGAAGILIVPMQQPEVQNAGQCHGNQEDCVDELCRLLVFVV